jgi:hypothetical protein
MLKIRNVVVLCVFLAGDQGFHFHHIETMFKVTSLKQRPGLYLSPPSQYLDLELLILWNSEKKVLLFINFKKGVHLLISSEFIGIEYQ